MHRLMNGLARYMALLGGVVLTLLIVLTCVSVLGRGMNTFLHSDLGEQLLGGATKTLLDTGVGPILGDFELVEAGIAFAIFSFLPLTQLKGAHAKVDVFTSGMGEGVNRALGTFWSIVMAAVIVLITWRLFIGMQDKIRYGETTYLIQFPIWWAYAASLIAAICASIVSIYCAAMRLTGQRAI